MAQTIAKIAIQTASIYLWHQSRCISSHWDMLRRRISLNKSLHISELNSCECSPRIMPQQNTSLTNMAGRSFCEWQQVITRFLSRVKKLHTHLLWERGGKLPFECAAAAFYCSLENGVGICIVKGLRGARWGTLTSSLWAEESHINCSRGRLPSLSMGFRLQFQVKYHGLEFNN